MTAAWSGRSLPGGGCLALFETKDIQPSAEAGGRIALEVEDLDALIARRMSVILDSEGDAIILHELKKKATA